MTIKTDGIIIRESTTGEQDRLVTVLTRERGVITAFVNGARNPKNKNVSSTGMLCYSDLVIDKTQKGVHIIREAIAKEIFFSLRNDIVKLSLAQYFAELTYELAPREEESSEFLSLILNGIYLTTQGKRDLKLIKAVMELRMLSIAGYMPDLVSCQSCGCFESENMYFNARTGEVYCENCLPPVKCPKVSLGVITAMRHICYSSAGKVFNFTLAKDNLITLSDLTERYLINITSRKYKTLEFYKTMAD